MTLLHFDGFEDYANSTDFQRAGYVFYSAYVSTSIYRTGTRAMYGDGYSSGVTKDLGAAVANDTIIMGVAARRQDSGASSYDRPIIKIHGDTTDTTQLKIAHNTLGQFLVYRGSTLLGTSDNEGDLGTQFEYYEIKYLCHQTAGTVTIKKNGNVILDLSGIDTAGRPNTNVRYIGLRGYGSGLSSRKMYYDDWYILDTGGSSPTNDYLGDVRVDRLKPNGAGYHTDYSPSEGSNYENVDDTTPDYDTTYNSSNNVGDKDTYALENLVYNGGTIFGAKNLIYVNKSDVGTRAVKALLRTGSADFQSDELSLSTTWGAISKVYEQNPNTSLAWTDSDINSLEVGVETTQ